ncbi:MAG: hypothetical protein IPF58_04255 [Saprospirales bacterium]|nr:hypothetical protein [Saprospirales bacterium]
MNTRLVLNGEIGTDRTALIAINLDEATAKIHIYAFTKEVVTKEIQDKLFVEWKNGGEYDFPASAIHWEVDANSDSILPENVKVDRPEIVLQSQHKWSKKLMSSKINQLLDDETKLLEEKASSVAEYDQTLWDKTKTQWEKITSYQKKNEITWEQTTVLKEKINSIFDALKAVKRINSENDDQANAALVKNITKRIDDLQSKLIYSDQWKFIFDELKKIQAELKDVAIKWNHKRNLYNRVNAIYDDLKKYRATEIIAKSQTRITQLKQILNGLKDSIERDDDNFKMQVEKMQHYTRGKITESEIKTRFSYILERVEEKRKKAEGIKLTIEQLKNEIAKEKQQQQEREQEKIKREEELLAKQEEAKKKLLLKKEADTLNIEVENATTDTAETTNTTVNIEEPNVEVPLTQETEVKEIETVATEEITETKNADVETVEATTEEVK